jgi:hypothetical protein
VIHLRRDPGPCPVDDAPHTTCCAPVPAGGIVIVQLPARDGFTDPPLVGALQPPAPAGAVPAIPAAPPLLAERLQATLPPGATTTGTYRRKRSTR